MTAAATEVDYIGQHAMDIPAAWLRTPAFEPPLSPEAVAACQKDIDSVAGTTRDGKSIAKLVWNGDTKYWKGIHDDWNSLGQPIGGLKLRPIVLFQSIYDGTTGDFVRDAFPPRWLILTRLEPEQYADDWARSSKVWCEDRKCYIQILPSEPPKERYLWFMTVALHTQLCCTSAAREERACYGRYAHPNVGIEELRRIRRGMTLEGFPDSSPFDSPDRLAQKLRDAETNNYVEQAMAKYRQRQLHLIDSAPMTLASREVIAQSGSLADLRRRLTEIGKHEAERVEKKLQKQEQERKKG